MSTTYTLKTPVTHGGKTYAELTFRRPRTGDMVLTDKFDGPIAKTVALLAAVSDTPVQAFHLIELDDFNAISDLIGPMLGEFHPAVNGSTS